MKRAILAVAVTAIISGNALALGDYNDNRKDYGGDGGAGGTAIQGQGQGQGQMQGQGQLQGQMQGQGQSSFNANRNSATGVGVGIAGAAAAAGSFSSSGGNSQANRQHASQTNSQAVTVTDSGQMHYSGKYEVKTPGYAPDIVANPTAPCRIAVGIGASVMGGGGSIVGSVLDEGCDARADATMLMALDRPADAVRRLCLKPELAEVLPECRAPAAAPAVSGGSVQSSPKVASNKVGGGGFSH